jgi:hypothetical protein
VKNKFKKKNYNFILKSISTKKLKKNEIKQICLLKDKQWKFGKSSQLKWFKDNIRKFDFHNLFFINFRLIGYTLLRKKICKLGNSKKTTRYLLLDTLVIDKKYRGLKLSNLLMCFNNTIIKQSGLFSFLICKNKFVNFYKKNNWVKLKKKKFDVLNYPSSYNGMVYNKKANKNKLIININR